MSESIGGATPGGVELTVLVFAQAAESLGFREQVIECAPTDTPRVLVRRLAPGLDTASVRVAVDLEYVGWDEAIGDARELALIPPVSGG